MGTRTRGFANNITSPSGVFDATDLNGVVPATNIANSSLTNVTEVSPSLGFSITSVASDPPAPSEGQMWYNTTSNTLKGYLNVASNSWAAGGNLNTARQHLAGAGTQTSALAFSGFATAPSTATEEYDGTSWTTVNSMNTARYSLGGCGTQTAALGFGGYSTTNLSSTEKWNGTSWTSNPTGLGTARYSIRGFGTQTAAIAAAGATYPPTVLYNLTESFNGTSWTSVNALNNTKAGGAAAGIQTAGLYFGGSGPVSPLTQTESWNGTSWTAVNTMNTARQSLAGAGTQTASLAFGGGPPTGLSSTELWDGTSWTSNPTGLATARQTLAGAGTQPAALAFGGSTGDGGLNNTEEWTGTALATRTITAS